MPLLKALAGAMGFKAIKYYVDSWFRAAVTPVPGSVLYCDLWVAVEHSGIYVGNGKISNIVVDGFAESSVCLDSAASFTSKATMGSKIYVSCDSRGAVGDLSVAEGAQRHVGERGFYGLVYKNCHEFSTKCVNYAPAVGASAAWRAPALESWERTLRALKDAAHQKLGATKWRLWDWENAAPPEEPDWQAQQDYFRHLPLDADSIARVRQELAAVEAYQEEVADEALPSFIRERLAAFHGTLADVERTYEQAQDFLAANPGARWSCADLQACQEDYSALAQAMRDNQQIRELARRLGRNHVDQQQRQRARLPQMSRSEVHGTHRSDDVMRMLPSELLNLEDDTLEVLFYARLLEKNLLSYQLQGITLADGEHEVTSSRHTGPVVACLDTSGSMQGAALLKAKALLLVIANILQQEQRSLHVLLFGDQGQLREFAMTAGSEAPGLLAFLQQGYGGGTDFETPLQRALDIIGSQHGYLKADILMISDGDCTLSPAFITHLQAQKQQHNCLVYSVLCAGGMAADGYSDAVIVL